VLDVSERLGLGHQHVRLLLREQRFEEVPRPAGRDEVGWWWTLELVDAWIGERVSRRVHGTARDPVDEVVQRHERRLAAPVDELLGTGLQKEVGSSLSQGAVWGRRPRARAIRRSAVGSSSSAEMISRQPRQGTMAPYLCAPSRYADAVGLEAYVRVPTFARSTRLRRCSACTGAGSGAERRKGLRLMSLHAAGRS